MTEEQKQKFRNAASDPKVRFYFVPSPKLKQLICEDSDPILRQLARYMKSTILACDSSSGIALDSNLVISFVEGTLDARNAYWLKMGDVRVLGVGDMTLRS